MLHVCLAGSIELTFIVMSHCYTMQLTLPDDIQSKRCGHSVTAISLAPGVTEVTMFGGSSSHRPNDCIAATTIISFGEFKSCPHHVVWILGGGGGGGGEGEFEFHKTSLSSILVSHMGVPPANSKNLV